VLGTSSGALEAAHDHFGPFPDGAARGNHGAQVGGRTRRHLDPWWQPDGQTKFLVDVVLGTDRRLARAGHPRLDLAEEGEYLFGRHRWNEAHGVRVRRIVGVVSPRVCSTNAFHVHNSSAAAAGGTSRGLTLSSANLPRTSSACISSVYTTLPARR
jgi:hypothetical protein